MSTHDEVDRLKRTYDGYRRTASCSVQWSPDNWGNQAILAERTRVLARMLQRRGLVPLEQRRVLDVGCGYGSVLQGLTRWGAVERNLHGVDLIPDRIAAARERFSGIRFDVANAEALPFGHGYFDIVLLFTVFSSILDHRMARNVAAEVGRVLNGTGVVIWYDLRYDNPFNHQVRGLPRRSILNLFPGFDAQLETVTVVPMLARRLGHVTPVLYPALARIPFLRTHHIGLLVKRL